MSGTRRSEPAPLIWTQPAPPPRQRALGRDEIVQAAIDVADHGGLQALTMSAVARRLGPYSPMALYRYIHSKDGLIDLMLDSATAEVPVPDAPSGDWRGDLHRLAMQTWDMVRRHGWYAQLIHTRPPLGPHMMRRTEYSLAVLVGQGASTVTAMTYAALIDRHIFGNGLQAVEEDRMRTRYGLDSTDKFLAAIASARAQTSADNLYPNLAAWMAKPSETTTADQVELGLTFLLDGIANRLTIGS